VIDFTLKMASLAESTTVQGTAPILETRHRQRLADRDVHRLRVRQARAVPFQRAWAIRGDPSPFRSVPACGSTGRPDFTDTIPESVRGSNQIELRMDVFNLFDAFNVTAANNVYGRVEGSPAATFMQPTARGESEAAAVRGAVSLLTLG
jgi:hypothetical protein